MTHGTYMGEDCPVCGHARILRVRLIVLAGVLKRMKCCDACFEIYDARKVG